MDVYKGNYEFYEMNDLTNLKTIIKEEPGNEESLYINSTINKGIKSKFINNNYQLNTNCINKSLINEKGDLEENTINDRTKQSNALNNNNSNLKKSKDKNESLDNLVKFYNMYIVNKENFENNKSIKEKEKSNHSSSSEINNDLLRDISNNSLNDIDNNESNNTLNKIFEINKEIYPGENIIIPNKEENILKKKYSLRTFQKSAQFFNNNNNINENAKLKFILDSNKGFITSMNNDFTENDYKKNNLENINNNENNFLEINKFFEDKKTNLSIESNIQIELLSIYENINLLAKYKYYNNEPLQLKIKNILEKESESKNISFSCSSDSININNNSDYKDYMNKSLRIMNIPNTNKKKSISSSKLIIKRTNTNNNSVNNFCLNSPKRGKMEYNKRCSSYIKRNNNSDIDDKLESELIRKKKHIQTKNNSSLNIIEIKKYTEANITSKSLKNHLSKDNDKTYNRNKNKTLLITNQDFFKKKKKDNLLSKINSNIKKSNQNLNNPDEFYSNYFQKLLKRKKKNMGKEDKKRFSIIADNIICSPKNNKFKRVKTKCVKKINLNL